MCIVLRKITETVVCGFNSYPAAFHRVRWGSGPIVSATGTVPIECPNFRPNVKIPANIVVSGDPKCASSPIVLGYCSVPQCLCWFRTGQKMVFALIFVVQKCVSELLTPLFRDWPTRQRLSGSFANMFSAKSATHCINCCRLCSVDFSTVKSLPSRPSSTLSMSGTDSDNTTEKEPRSFVSSISNSNVYVSF